MKRSLILVPVLLVMVAFAAFASVSPTITRQPAGTTILYSGSVSGSLTVEANIAGGGAVSFQWFQNTQNNNNGGTPIAGATNASFPIPTDLAPGTYFFFSEVRTTGGAAVIRSNVARVMVFDASTIEACELC